MIDALDALKLIRAQGLRKPAARVAIPKAVSPLVNVFQKPAGPTFDQFLKAMQTEAGMAPKTGRAAVESKAARAEAATKASLEKPAPSGGTGGLFQTLKTRFLAKVTPAPVQGALLNPVKKLQQAIEATKMHISETAPKPAMPGQHNPFRTMEAVLLNQHMDAAGLKNSAIPAQALNGTKPEMKSSPVNAVSAIVMPLAGVGMLAAPVLGPAAVVVKPGLINPFIAKLPTFIP